MSAYTQALPAVLSDRPVRRFYLPYHQDLLALNNPVDQRNH